MVQTDNYYWYGIAAAVYLVTCWVFSAVRTGHNCGVLHERQEYIWPDRKMQILIYLTGTVVLPYVLNPQSEPAWLLMKSYFPCTYYFFCGSLLFCFFGSVKQWASWKPVVRIAAFITLVAIIPFVVHAWWPDGVLGAGFVSVWNKVVLAVSLLMMAYSAVAMWQVWLWMRTARAVSYSNPDDFPTEYAHRVWIVPILLTPLLWPAYLTDSRDVMAVLCVPLAVFNILLLLNVLPVWRRSIILSEIVDEDMDPSFDENDELAGERTDRIAAEIEQFVSTEAAYLDSHLKLEQVVERCNFSRVCVSRVFTERFGGFSDYVNGLRLDYFDHYKIQHPNSTDEAAAEASGFASLKAYTKARERLSQRQDTVK
jgi:hypothetical protein